MVSPVTFEFPPGRVAGRLEWGRQSSWAKGVVQVPADRPVRFLPWPSPERFGANVTWNIDDEDDLAGLTPLFFDDVVLLPCMRQVDALNVEWRTFDGEIEHVARLMDHLGELDLHDTFVTATGLVLVAGMAHLRRLSIVDASNLSFADCATLAGSPIGDLRLTLLAEAGHGLAALAGLPRLRTLDLSHNRRIGDGDLAELVAVAQLTRLDLRYCGGLTDKVAQTLAAMPNLRHVELSGTKLSAAALDRLRHAKPALKVTTTGAHTLPRDASPRKRSAAPVRREVVLLRRLTDARIRSAIERRAVSVAAAHLKRLGCSNITDVGTVRSWDLECEHGDEQWRIEVKGTRGPLGAVELTANEVLHARRVRDGELTCRLGLFVCTDISVTGGDGDDPPTATGGTGHWFFPWDLDDALLYPTAYTFDAHRIPTPAPTVT